MKKFVRSLLTSRLKKLDGELRLAARAPDDPEAIHGVRVSIRRLVQCLRTFEQLFEAAESKKIRRRLRKLMDHCGAVRNFDIAREVLQEAGLREEKLAAGFVRPRERAQKELTGKLRPWKRTALHKWRKALAVHDGEGVWRLRESVADNARRVLPGQAAELFDAGQLAAAPASTHETMHEFRLLTKRFRYTLELFQTAYGEELGEGIAALRRLQDKLGAISDCATTLGLIKRNQRATEAVRRLASRRVSEFREYWSETFDPAAKEWWQAMLASTSSTPQTSSDHPRIKHGNLHPEARRRGAA